MIFFTIAVKLSVGWMSNLGGLYFHPLDDPPHEMETTSFQWGQCGSDFKRFTVQRVSDGNSTKFIQLAESDEELPFVIFRLYKHDDKEGSRQFLKYTFESVWVENYGRLIGEGAYFVETIDFLAAETRVTYRSPDALGLDMQARMSGIKRDL